MIVVPLEVGDEAVVDKTVEALRIDFMIIPLAGGMLGIGFDMLSTECVIVVLDVVIALEVVVPAS